jgi:N-acetylglucosamine kinase-like BadF-type ATPase
MRLFLGVDGGQSGTTALIGDETGRVVGIGHAGPVNHVGAAEGRAKFLSALGGSLTAAAEQAGLTAPEFESACLGFSGGPADKEALTREIVKSSRYSITHDALIALSGATAGQPGVVVIAGTGSIAFGRNAEGRTARAGGWGYIFGDEGGAFDLVRRALRAVLRHEEGWGPPTRLRDSLLAAAGASDANDLLHRWYTEEYPRTRVAALAPLVEVAAAEGDAEAYNILMSSAHNLAKLATAVRRQLFVDFMPALVSYSGGVFRCRAILDRFRLVVAMEEGNRVEAPQFGPAAGALLEAYRAAGVECTLKDVSEPRQ